MLLGPAGGKTQRYWIQLGSKTQCHRALLEVKKSFINLFFYLLYEKKLNKKKEKNLKKQKKIGNIWRPNQTQ
jgi:hypothetical protein